MIDQLAVTVKRTKIIESIVILLNVNFLPPGV